MVLRRLNGWYRNKTRLIIILLSVVCLLIVIMDGRAKDAVTESANIIKKAVPDAVAKSANLFHTAKDIYITKASVAVLTTSRIKTIGDGKEKKEKIFKQEKTQKCKIPQLNPFDPDILPYLKLKNPFMQACKNKRYGVVKNDILRVKAKDVVAVYLNYIERVDDFKFKLSGRHHVFGTGTDGKECWTACGKRGGHCPKFCGKDGYCCKAGFGDCPSNIHSDMMSDKSHTCIKADNVSALNPHRGKECWKACGKKGGSCPKVCGPGGYCCRVGFKGCPSSISVQDMSKTSHTCTSVLKHVGRYGEGKDCDVTYKVNQEYFKVQIFFSRAMSEEYHYSFLNKTQRLGVKKTPPDEQINIMIILFDSMSRSHATRSLKKAWKYLSEDPATVIMQGHTIVGDGTTSQMTAMLTGIPEKEHPEARRGWKNAGFVDRWPFIYTDLHKRNYVTLWSEHEHGAGTFHYRLKGFNKIPTTFYTRQMWLAMRKHIGNQISCPHQYHFMYMKDFFDYNRDYNKFAIVFNALIHNKVDRLENADDDIYNFLKHIENSEHAKNTVIVFMGDHGLRTSTFRSTLQGKLEERLPMVAIKLPPSLNVSKDHMANLRKNSKLLTSHFDLYSTYQHLSTYPHLNSHAHQHKYGRSFFTDITKLNRTCAEAGVDNHWCTCLNYAKVDISKDPHVRQLIDKIIDFINTRNQQTVPDKCEALKLKNVTVAGKRTPNAEVNQFKGTKTQRGKCDSCDILYDKSKKFNRFIYEVNFIVSPSNAGYEASGEVIIKEKGDAEINIDINISRTNLYGNQPNCIADQYPHLRQYCYCRDFDSTLST